MSRALVMSDYADPDTEIERLRGVVGAELAWHEPKPDGFRQRPICRVCSELSRSSDNRWACSAGMRLSAALAELEGKPYKEENGG